MRKNDLIKLLQSIEGNPQVVIWNGFTHDYQHIDKTFIPLTLYKPEKSWLKKKIIDLQRSHLGKNPISEEEFNQLYSNIEYEKANRFYTENEIKERYSKKTKKLIVFNVLERNKIVFDRLGSYKY